MNAHGQDANTAPRHCTREDSRIQQDGDAMIARRRKVKTANGEGPEGKTKARRIVRKSRGHPSIRSSVSRTIRRVLLTFACFLSIGGLGYYRSDLVLKFLNGPDVTAVVREQNLEARSRLRHQDPTAHRLESTDIATGFSEKEKRFLEKMRNNFDLEKDSKNLTPCSSLRDCLEVGSWGQALARLRGTSGQDILVRNTLPYDRYLCGKQILGNGGTLVIDSSKLKSCLGEEQPYIFSAHPPPLSGKGLKPVDLIWNHWTEYLADEDQINYEDFQCSVPCRRIGEISLMNVVAVRGTRWEFLSTMEGEQYYSEAKFRKGSHRNDQFYALPSFKSEIPMPYFSWSEYKLQGKAVDFDKAIKGASFLANNCDSASHREAIVTALMKSPLRVDSLSSCLHNAAAPNGVDMSNKTAIQERYLFHLAFENQLSDDYITEKLWGTLASGTLPIYYGAPNIKEHLPPRSVVFVEDFETHDDLANFLIRLSEDKALYQSYHEWRTKPLDEAFIRKYNFTSTHSTCRMCKWAHAKLHGFHWNHEQQDVEQPHIARKTCRNKAGLIGYPFKEYWLDKNGAPVRVETAKEVKTCAIDSLTRSIDIDGGQAVRTLYDQDGVTDLVITHGDALAGDFRFNLQLETPIQAAELVRLEPLGQAWWLQDSQSRMTILVDSNTTVNVVKSGTVEVSVAEPMHLRIIMENIDTFYRGSRKRANFYGELLQSDFFEPLEFYAKA